jgi:hypothetical protein
MSLQSKRELEVTREKLRGLEQLYEKTAAEAGEQTYARQLTLRSLKRSINQFREEIARFETKTSSHVSSD